MKKINAGLNNLSAAKGNSKGEINLQWDSVQNAVSYLIEFSRAGYSGKTEWKILDIISDSRYTVRNLKSNRIYRFRIAPCSESGIKEPGSEISKQAP